MSEEDKMPILEIGKLGYFNIKVKETDSIGYQNINVDQDVESPGKVRVTVEFIARLKSADA